MIYTSYYYQLQKEKYKQFNDLQLIVVSNTINRFISKEARKKLITRYQDITKPGKTLLREAKNGIISKQEYKIAYINILNGNLITHEKLFLELINLAKTQGIVLFCHEGKDKFCHRRILAKWLVNLAIKYKITLEASEWKPRKNK